MDEIHNRKITMRPRIYFIIGSVIGFVGLVALLVSAVFLFSLTRFAFRSHGPMGDIRMEELLTSFPWWAPVLGGICLVGGIFVLRRYDISYKRNFGFLAVGVILALLMTVLVIDYYKFDEKWFTHPQMKKVFHKYYRSYDDHTIERKINEYPRRRGR